MAKRDNLLLIDGHNFLWKSYGIPFKFHSEKGTPLHVATAFLSLVRRSVAALEEYGGCSFVAVVFDSQGMTSNHRLSSAYKANRKKDFSQDEDSPFHHLPLVKKTLSKLKIKTYEKRGFEADDMIASLASKFRSEFRSRSVFIASSDSDFYQLVSPKLKIVHLGKDKSHTIVGPEWVEEKLNVRPRQYVYFKSLMGDTSDNIAGIPGVGPVRASRIVNGEIPFNMNHHRELLSLNKKLIGLSCNLSLCKDWRILGLNYDRMKMKNQEIFESLKV